MCISKVHLCPASSFYHLWNGSWSRTVLNTFLPSFMGFWEVIYMRYYSEKTFVRVVLCLKTVCLASVLFCFVLPHIGWGSLLGGTGWRRNDVELLLQEKNCKMPLLVCSGAEQSSQKFMCLSYFYLWVNAHSLYKISSQERNTLPHGVFSSCGLIALSLTLL